MAPAKHSEAKQPEPELDLPPTEAPKGEGWEEGGSPDIDGWWTPKQGSVIAGRLVGSLKITDRDGNSRDVALVKLSYDCADAVREKKPVVLRKGQVLGVGVREKIKDILSYVEHRGAIWLKAVEQRDIGGGKTMWVFESSYKGERAVPPEPREIKQGTEDDIPF